MIFSLDFEHLVAISAPHWNPVQHISMAGGLRSFQYPHSIPLIGYATEQSLEFPTLLTGPILFFLIIMEYLQQKGLDGLKLYVITLITS